jgi:hypothetical protein
MDGVGRGNNLWDNAETYYRNNFCNDPAYGAYSSPRAYYYGMFSFVKSMILHDPVGNGVAQPITLLKSATPGVSPIDWYSAQASAGDQCDGVAQTLVHDQNPGAGQGYWFGHNYSGEQDYFETAQAIIMLNRTLFSSAPVALPVATPNPLMINQTVTLDGSGSYHQDPSKHIVQWDWDFDNNGTFDATGPIVTTSFPTLGIYPVKLRVTDDGTPAQTAEAYVNVNVTIPPIAPTANAGGPYNFCPQTTPWILNGSKSVNPDNGQSAGAGFPGDFITSYAWDLSSSGLYTDALGVTPDVTSFFSGKNTGIYLVSLKVTDNSSKSFGLASDLSGTASAQVNLLAVDDPACGGCISNLKSLSKNKLVQLTWSKVSWANSYNIFRSTVSGGPYSQIATTSGSASGAYLDYSVTNNTTYYYVVKPTTLAGASCQSNQISAKPTAAR